jgi:hypothetical protein
MGWHRRLLITGGCLVAVLGLASLVMRFTVPPVLSEDKVNHPLAGVWFAPNTPHTVQGINGEYRVAYRTDGQGIPIRTGSNAPRRGALRVMVVGDSYMQGDYVPMDQTMSVILEEEMREALGRDVQVVNLGLNVTSPLNYAMTYRAFKDRYDPDVVILAFGPANDITEDARLYHDDRILYGPDGQPEAIKAYFDLKNSTFWLPFYVGDQQAETPLPYLVDPATWKRGVLPVAGTLFRERLCAGLNWDATSWSLQIPPEEVVRAPLYDGADLPCNSLEADLTPMCFNWAIRENSLIRNNELAVYKESYRPEDREDIERTLSSIALMAEEVEAEGRIFVLLTLPHGLEIEGEQQGIAGSLGVPPDTLIDGSAIHALVGDFCTERSLVCLDLLDPFRAHQGSLLFLRYDTHWSLAGNRVAAESLTDLLVPLLEE